MEALKKKRKKQKNNGNTFARTYTGCRTRNMGNLRTVQSYRPVYNEFALASNQNDRRAVHERNTVFPYRNYPCGNNSGVYHSRCPGLRRRGGALGERHGT